MELGACYVSEFGLGLEHRGCSFFLDSEKEEFVVVAASPEKAVAGMTWADEFVEKMVRIGKLLKQKNRPDLREEIWMLAQELEEPYNEPGSRFRI